MKRYRISMLLFASTIFVSQFSICMFSCPLKNATLLGTVGGTLTGGAWLYEKKKRGHSKNLLSYRLQDQYCPDRTLQYIRGNSLVRNTSYFVMAHIPAALYLANTNTVPRTSIPLTRLVATTSVASATGFVVVITTLRAAYDQYHQKRCAYKDKYC